MQKPDGRLKKINRKALYMTMLLVAGGLLSGAYQMRKQVLPAIVRQTVMKVGRAENAAQRMKPAVPAKAVEPPKQACTKDRRTTPEGRIAITMECH